MKRNELFRIDSETIDIKGLEAMVQFTRFNPFDPESFLNGLELSDDLTNKYGTVLYARGTKITPNHIARLIELQESNPALDFYFRISRSAALIQTFRAEIKEQVFSLFNRQRRTNIYSDFLSHIATDMETFIDEILKEENITLLIYQMRFLCKTSGMNKSSLFMEHPINVALIALAIASSKPYESVIGKARNKLLDVFRAGIFHNYGALTVIDEIMDAPDDVRLPKYWEAVRDGYQTLSDSGINYEIKDALMYFLDYQAGQRDFINKTIWTMMIANIIVVAELFLRKESGLFGDPMIARKIVDQLNVRVAEKQLDSLAVQALTLGLNLQELFDFYRELNNLVRKCPYNSATPYPLVGFKSPTLFICKNEVMNCKYIEGSLKAVNLIHDVGELKKGKYRRCWLLTPQLQLFYQKHYRAIKGITNSIAELKKSD